MEVWDSFLLLKHLGQLPAISLVGTDREITQISWHQKLLQNYPRCWFVKVNTIDSGDYQSGTIPNQVEGPVTYWSDCVYFSNDWQSHKYIMEAGVPKCIGKKGCFNSTDWHLYMYMHSNCAYIAKWLEQLLIQVIRLSTVQLSWWHGIQSFLKESPHQYITDHWESTNHWRMMTTYSCMFIDMTASVPNRCKTLQLLPQEYMQPSIFKLLTLETNPDFWCTSGSSIVEKSWPLMKHCWPFS